MEMRAVGARRPKASRPWLSVILGPWRSPFTTGEMFKKLFGRFTSGERETPELKQFADLRASDFDRYPVWVLVHTMDYDESWYENTDEETVRPWTGSTPVDPSKGMFLVRASFTLADGSEHGGFVTPAQTDPAEPDFGTLQPHVFAVDGKPLGFWLGAFGHSEADRAAYYRRLGRNSSEVFPIDFTADNTVSSIAVAGTLAGFYAIPDFQTVHIVR
jgi:hypothetical protein